MPHDATVEFVAAATGTLALAPPTMSYTTPPVRVDGVWVGVLYVLELIESALLGPTIHKRMTLGGTYIRLSTASVPTGRPFRSGTTVTDMPGAEDEGIVVGAVFMFELWEYYALYLSDLDMHAGFRGQYG